MLSTDIRHGRCGRWWVQQAKRAAATGYAPRGVVLVAPWMAWRSWRTAQNLANCHTLEFGVKRRVPGVWKRWPNIFHTQVDEECRNLIHSYYKQPAIMVSWFLRQSEYSRKNNAYASLVAYDIISSHNLVFPIFVIWRWVNSYEFQMWSGSYFFKHFPSHSGGILVRWLFHNLPLSWFSDMGMDQYLLIPFLVGWTSINPSYFDVHYRGTIGFDTLPYD